MSDEVAQCVMAPRNVVTLNDRAWTKEWLEAFLLEMVVRRQCLGQAALTHEDEADRVA